MAAAKKSRSKAAVPGRGSTGKVAGIGSEAVQLKTGRTWDEWVVALDAAGARAMDHAAIAKLVHEEFHVGDWWTQMVTVGYEQLVGKRVVGQKADGFAASASRTLDAPPVDVWNAFNDRKLRARWLADEFTITTAKSPKSVRILWKDGKSRVDVNIYPKGTGRSQLSVQHSRLSSAREATRMKSFWGDALDRLKTALAWKK